MEDTPTLTARELSCHRDGTQVLTPLNLTLNAGEVCVLLGPNGAGKSTLLQILAGCRTADTGTLAFADKSNTGRVGYLPDTPPLYNDLTITEQLTFAATLQRMSKAALSTRIKEVMALCHISERQHQLIGQLSKGYRQRTGLAQALIHSPSLLLLDEPTEGLDPGQIINLRQLIKNLAAEGTAILLSTHLLDEARHIASRVLFLNKGQLLGDLTLEDLHLSGESLESIYQHVIMHHRLPPLAEATS